MWFTEARLYNENDMMLRISELAFYNAGFLARLYTELCGAVDFETCDNSAKKI